MKQKNYIFLLYMVVTLPVLGSDFARSYKPGPWSSNPGFSSEDTIFRNSLRPDDPSKDISRSLPQKLVTPRGVKVSRSGLTVHSPRKPVDSRGVLAQVVCERDCQKMHKDALDQRFLLPEIMQQRKVRFRSLSNSSMRSGLVHIADK